MDLTAQTEKKTIIFTIARMNPPTSGHVNLIKTMLEANIALPPEDLGHDIIYILLSHTKDNVKNPLSCSRKREILLSQGMVEHIKAENPALNAIAVKIICMDDLVPAECGKHPILKHMCNIRLIEHPSEMKLFIGEDRADSYDFLRSSLAKYDPPILVVPVVLPRPEGAMSATFMRELVTSGKKADFLLAAQNNGLNLTDAEVLYEEIKYELTPDFVSLKTPASKRRKGGNKRSDKKHKRSNKKHSTKKHKHKHKRKHRTKKHHKKRYSRK